MGTKHRIEQYWDNKRKDLVFVTEAENAFPKANQCLLDIDEILIEVGETIGYNSKESEIEEFFEDVEMLENFVENLPLSIETIIDEDFYIAFNHGVTEELSAVKLENYETPNTTGASRQTESLTPSGKAVAQTEVPDMLNLLDFMGISSTDANGNPIFINEGINPELDGFIGSFRGEYEASGSDLSLTAYLEGQYTSGEYDHKKDQPILEFISTIADATVVVPLIEYCIGYDFITGEELNANDKGMKLFSFVIGAFGLGYGLAKAGVGLTIEELLGLAGRQIVIDMAAAAVQYTSNAALLDMGVPEPLALVLSMIAAGFVYKAGEGWVKGNGKPVPVAEDIIITDGSHLVNGKLKPNCRYKVGEFDYIYQTDANGRIINWNTDNLQLTNRNGRVPHNPNTPGKAKGDHAGHLAGDRFGGSPDIDNLISQDPYVNQSTYKRIENQWAKAIEEGKNVTVDVNITYDGAGLRPTEFNVNFTIDGNPFSQSILN
jgi:hypothetical protein